MSTPRPQTPDELPEADVFSPEFTADVMGGYGRLLEQSWAWRTPRGVEILSYDACQTVFQDPRFRSGAMRLLEFLGPDTARMLVGDGRTMLGSEGDDHRRTRGTLSPWFTPKRIDRLREATIRLVDDLLDGVEADGGCEFVDDIARVVPGAVFCWMVGAPEADGADLCRWSETLVKVFNADPADATAILDAHGELRGYIDALVEAKRKEPADDIASMLVAAERSGQITAADVVSLLLEVLSASTDNTTRSAATQLWLLARHPAQWDHLVADAGLVPAAVEECARFEPSVGSTPVLNLEQAEVGGLVLPAGALSWLVLSAAHRDPAVFPDPDRFDITRTTPEGQLSFGIGRHYCLGANLARMELRVILQRLVARWERPRLGEGVVVDHLFGTTVRSLPVAFVPRRTS